MDKDREGYTYPGKFRVKRIFRQSRLDYKPSDVRGFSDAINNHWGIPGLYNRMKVCRVEKVAAEGSGASDELLPRDIHFVAPFTVYSEAELIEIAKSEELPAGDDGIRCLILMHVTERGTDIASLAKKIGMRIPRLKELINNEQFTESDIAKLKLYDNFLYGNELEKVLEKRLVLERSEGNEVMLSPHNEKIKIGSR